MYSVQQDKGSDKYQPALNMFCYQEEDTAQVVLRLKPAYLTPQPSPLTCAQQWRQWLSHWTPPSSVATHSSEMARTRSSIVTLLSKPLSYSPSSNLGLVNSHSHLDFPFSRVRHAATYAKLRLNHRDTLPDYYKGCVANFCNATTFNLHHM
ncbi:hypothetical protein HPB49_020083 [Dermacentor silvarum]|uniref:Uncharacterized protein n=1 Tax=Dermacentor silvarum TaxID=543639 RepID=A0ACB8E329_DERSI|nr:hypothetical protein HPB49_020083 [Dermacentor silvarum]